jgi:hypothetical protein
MSQSRAWEKTARRGPKRKVIGQEMGSMKWETSQQEAAWQHHSSSSSSMRRRV